MLSNCNNTKKCWEKKLSDFVKKIKKHSFIDVGINNELLIVFAYLEALSVPISFIIMSNFKKETLDNSPSGYNSESLSE